MRNLKRALSLTLASVMLLGMMVIGTSAASYTDEDQISNKTAAAVLKELNIMVGDGTSFGPETTVTRGQMAIIICKMLYGNNLNVSQFSGTTQFNDVPANSYFTGYVNLANSLGIISGYGDGNFGPGDPVTTAQAALMLCRALGYFQAGELSGQGWSNNALTAITQATKLGLFGELNLETNADLSRDNVAEMSFNALTKATPVMYNDLWHMYYTDSESIMSGIKFRYDETLGYRNYSLVYTAGEDDFGRPTTIWGTGDLSRAGANVIKDNGDIDTTIFTNIPQTNQIVEEANAPTASYDGKVSRVTLYNLIGRNAVNRLETLSGGADGDGPDHPEWYVFTDGEEYVNYDKSIFFDREDTTSIGRRSSTTAASTNGTLYGTSDLTGDGSHTDVYIDNDGNVTIAISNTYVIKATNDYSSRNNSVTTAVVSNNGTKTSAQISIPSSELTLSGEDFNVSGVKMDDYLLITVAGPAAGNKEIKSVEPANIITGTVDEFDADFVTIAGTKYGYGFTADSTGSHGKGVTYAINEETSVVADKNGYILYVDEVTVSAGRFVYIAGVENKTGNFTSGKFVANAYFLDGTSNPIDIKDTLKGGTAVNTSTPAGWYRYTVSNDVYTLEALSAGSAENNTGSVTTTYDAAGRILTENGGTKVGVNVASGDAVSANNTTIFVVIDENDDVAAYVGIDNAPTVQTVSGAAAGLTAHYVLGENGAYAKYVFIDASSDATVDAGASDEFVYLLREVRDGTDNKENTYTLWEAIVNGEKTTIRTTDDITASTDKLYGNVRYNANGYIRAMDVVDAADNYVQVEAALSGTVNYTGDVLTLGSDSFGTDANTNVWLIARDGNLMTTGSSYEVIGTSGNVTNGRMSANALYGLLRIYSVSGKYWVQTVDGKANSKAADIYVLVNTTTRVDNPNVTMSSGSTGTDIGNILNTSGVTNVEAPDAALSSSTVTVPNDKTLTITGSVTSSSATIDGAGDVVISGATVTGDLDVSGNTGDVTLNNVVVGASTNVTVDDVTITGTINLSSSSSVLTVEGDVDFSNATISAVAGATITIGGTAYAASGSGVGVKFYDEGGNELSFTARTAVGAGTYVYMVDYDGGDGSINPAITGFVLQGGGPVVGGEDKNVLGTIATNSTAAGVSITSAVVKDGDENTVAAEADLPAGTYTLEVTPGAGTSKAPVTITLSGVTASETASVGGTPSWGTTPASATVVTIDAGKTIAVDNVITFTFTVTDPSEGDGTVTVTPVITVATTGIEAELEVGVTYTNSSSPATPTWAENDTVTFTSDGNTALNITATVGNDNTTFTCSGAPSGWTATFDGNTLTLTANEKTDVATSPFGDISAEVSATGADAVVVDNAGVTWTAGVAATPTAA